jgi:hypothetical protein
MTIERVSRRRGWQDRSSAMSRAIPDDFREEV